MRKSVFSLAILAICIFSFSSVRAQSASQDKISLTGPTKFSSYSLLDPKRVDLHQGYSLSYFSSNKGSFSLGVYTAILDYHISSPLNIRLGFSYLHQPLGLLGNKNNIDIKQSILPSFELRYQPNDKTWLSIGFSTLVNPYGFQTE